MSKKNTFLLVLLKLNGVCLQFVTSEASGVFVGWLSIFICLSFGIHAP